MKFRVTKQLNQSGMASEIFILMVIFVVAAISAGATFAMATARSEQAYLAARLENNRTRMLIESSLGDSSRCSWQLSSPLNHPTGNPVFDVSTMTNTAGSAGIAVLSFNKLYYGLSINTPVIASRNEVLPTSATFRSVDRIQLEQVRTLGAGQFQGVIAVYYATSHVGFSTAPVTASINFTVDGAMPATATRIVGCSVGAGAAVAAGTPRFMIATQDNPYDQDGGDPAIGESSNFNVGANCPSGPLNPAFPVGGVPAPGGGYTVWYPRSFNCTNANTILGATLNPYNGQFTLPAGTYHIRASALGDGADLHQAKWVNLSTGTDVLLGTLEFADQDWGDATPSIVDGYFTVVGTQTFQMVHRYSNSDPSYPCSFGGAGGINPSLDNVYAHAVIELIQ